MPITFKCLQCNQRMTVKDELAGKRRRCPSCRHFITIPEGRYATPPHGTLVPPSRALGTRWPWYAGSAAMLALAATLAILFVVSAKRHTPAANPVVAGPVALPDLQQGPAKRVSEPAPQPAPAPDFAPEPAQNAAERAEAARKAQEQLAKRQAEAIQKTQDPELDGLWEVVSVVRNGEEKN